MASTVDSGASRPTIRVEAKQAGVAAGNKVDLQLDGARQLRSHNIDPMRFVGKPPESVISAINQNLPEGQRWQDNEATQKFVADAVEMGVEVHAKAGVLLAKASKEKKALTPEAAQSEAERQIRKDRVAVAEKAVRDAEKQKDAKAAEPAQQGAEQNPATQEHSVASFDVDKKVETAEEKTAREAQEKKEAFDKLTPEEQKKMTDAAAEQKKIEDIARAEHKNFDDLTPEDRQKALNEAEGVRIEQRQKAAEITQIIDEALKEAGKPGATRRALELIAAGEGVDIAKIKVREAIKAANSADTREQQSKATAELERARKVLDRAEAALTKVRSETDRMKKSDHTDKDLRLLIYEINMAEVRENLSAAQTESFMTKLKMQEAENRGDVGGRASAEIEFDAAEWNVRQLEAQRNTLNTEKGVIGTPEQQAKKHLVGEVANLTKGLIPTDETSDQKATREAKINDDPLGYLKKMTQNKESLEKILEGSGLDANTQKMILDTASSQIQVDALKKKDLKDKVVGWGGTGLIAFLIMLYTAEMTNKAKKGQGGM